MRSNHQHNTPDAYDPERSLQELASDVLRLYTTDSAGELLHILRSRYSPDAQFVDNLIAARPRCAVELQFYALHRAFARVELRAEEPKITPLSGRQAGLWQVSIDSTQCLAFSRNTGVAQHVLDEQAQLQVTTLLTVDPRRGQVLRHEDVWHNVPLRLPMLWRRLNAGWTNTVFRLLGWGREVERWAEEAAPEHREPQGDTLAYASSA